MTYIYLSNAKQHALKNDFFLLNFKDSPHFFSFRPKIGETFMFSNLIDCVLSGKIIEMDVKNKTCKLNIVNYNIFTKAEYFKDTFELSPFDVILAVPDKNYLEKFIETTAFFPIENIYLYFSKHSLNYKINLERINNILTRSGEQCHRLYLPKITILNSVHEVFNLDFEVKIIFQIDENLPCYTSLKIKEEKIKNDLSANLKTVFAFGPEGGFTVEEVAEFVKNNYQPFYKKSVVFPSWASLLLL